MTRSELVERIRKARAEIPNAGYCHRWDLIRHIRRMERDLKTYDYYRARG